MTTNSPFTAGTFEINAAGPAAPGGLSLQTYNGNGRSVKITVRRVDFLDEVASKLGVSILDHADMPALTTGPKRHVAVSIYKSLERYGCEGDRTETMRLADALLEDFVIIPNYDLPEVMVQQGLAHDHLVADAVSVQDDDVSDLWRKARSFIALALHRDAHPPVDEAQVGALADLLRSALGVTPETIAAGTLQLGSSDDIARRLIATGRVEVQA